MYFFKQLGLVVLLLGFLPMAFADDVAHFSIYPGKAPIKVWVGFEFGAFKAGRCFYEKSIKAEFSVDINEPQSIDMGPEISQLLAIGLNCMRVSVRSPSGAGGKDFLEQVSFHFKRLSGGGVEISPKRHTIQLP